MKERYVIQVSPVDAKTNDCKLHEFGSKKDMDAAFELIALASGIDGRRAFTGYGQCSSNGYIFKGVTMLEG